MAWPWRSSLVSLLLLLALGPCLGLKLDHNAARVDPISRVLGLLEDMQKQLEADGKKDEEVYDKVVCWCKETEKSVTAAIDEGKTRIADLTGEIEQGIATSARLGPEIEHLKKEAVRNDQALSEATTLREKQAEQFVAEKKDLTESIDALEQAVGVMNKKQEEITSKPTTTTTVPSSFLQMTSSSRSLLHVKSSLRSLMEKHPRFVNQALTPSESSLAAQFLQNQEGYDPGSSSGEILGILSTMLDNFKENLKTITAEEATNKAAFEKLEVAKKEEIEAGNGQVRVKEKEKAACDEKLAYDKKDKKTAQESLAANEKYLEALKERCAKNEQEYDIRQKTRREETKAINEALTVLEQGREKLLENAATTSFLQLGSKHNKSSRTIASSTLAAAAKRFSSPRLSALAIKARINSLTEVTKEIDKLIAQLKVEKAEELTKRDWCQAMIHQNTMEQDAKKRAEQDALILIETLEAQIKKAEGERKVVQDEIAELKKDLMKAAEDREAQNKAFQASVNDQRETQRLLQASLQVLADYYKDDSTFLQVTADPETRHDFSSAPKGFDSYKKNTGSKGVMALLEHIIAEAKEAENEAIKDESEAQADYEKLVKDTNANIATKETEESELEAQIVKSEGEKGDANVDLDNIKEAQKGLISEAGTLHSNCDFLLKNFALRQDAYDDEVGALIEAKSMMEGITGVPLGGTPSS